MALVAAVAAAALVAVAATPASLWKAYFDLRLVKTTWCVCVCVCVGTKDGRPPCGVLKEPGRRSLAALSQPRRWEVTT